MAYSQGYSNPFGFMVTPWVKRLIIANVAVFVVTLMAPPLVAYLQFDPRFLVPRVWTPFTYMFVHGGLFHILFNMLILFFFGPPLEERWGSREFVKFYLLAGLGGALLSVLLPYPIIGASGAVLGVMVAFAMFWPDNPIYIWGIFPVKAKWLVGFYVGVSVFYAFTGGQGGVAHLAHLGGALTAFGYLKSPWAPSAWGEVPAKRRKTGTRDWRRSFANLVSRPVEEEVSRPVAQIRPRQPPPRAGDDVDQILEKISKAGLSSLTAEERQRLEEASRRYRTN
jgi:membrane associated rhomboid family serine protease